MTKNYNTPQYRDSKRVTAFVNPKVKNALKKAAKTKKISISKEIAEALEKIFLG